MSTPSPSRRQSPRGDDLVLAALCTVAGPLLWWFGSTGLATGAPGGLRVVEHAVASACAGAGVLLAAWWLLAVLGTVLAALGHRARSQHLVRWGQSLSPAFLRRVTASVLGVNLVLAPGAWAGQADLDPAPAVVAHHGTEARGHAASPATVLPQPGWIAASAQQTGGERDRRGLPRPGWRPTAPAPPVPGAAHGHRTEAEHPRSVTVRAGDCLWDIAAEELGPYATDLEIDRRWRQWYQQNRAVIGPDPGLLVPGTVLTAPPVS